MITLASLSDQIKVEKAIAAAGRDSAARGRRFNARIGVEIDGRDYSGRIRKADWGQNATPITATITLAGNLPRSISNGRVKFYTEIEGVEVQLLHGEKTAVYQGEDAYCVDLLTSSSGSLLSGADAIKLGAFTEYQGRTPHSVVWDIARRMPYDLSRVRIEPVENIALEYTGSGTNPGFLAEETTGDVLSRLAENATVGYTYLDDAYNGFIAEIPRPLGGADGAARTYHASTLPDWHQNRPNPPDIRYNTVRVFNIDDRGTLNYEIIEEVPYQGQIRAPHQGRTLNIAFTDTSSNGVANARSLCQRVALEQSRMPHSGQISLPAFDPLAQKNDRFRVAELHRDDEGSWDLVWVMRMDAIKSSFAGSSGGSSASSGLLSTQVAYTATLLVEDKLAVPALIVPSRSNGVAQTPRPLYGLLGPANNEIYFDLPIDWTTAEADELIFTSPGASAAITTAGDEIIVSE